MKTSNKILLTIIICIFIGIIIAAAIVRFNVKTDSFIDAKIIFATKKKITGNGEIITKSYKLPEFNAINVGGETRISIKLANKSQVDLATDSNLLSHMKVYVKDKILYVNPDRNFSIDPSQPVNVVINTKTLRKVTLAGANKLSIPDINTKEFILNLGGASKCYLSGKVDDFYINAGGVSKVFAGKLIANNIHIKTGGMAKIIVHVNHKLDAIIMGNAKIKYYGNPTQISQHIAGSGAIEHMGRKKN
jgi:hypothetical protein